MRVLVRNRIVRIYTVIVRDSTGEVKPWETWAATPAKALMAAVELLPGFEIVRIYMQGDW